MDAIGSINSTATQAAQAVQAGQATTAPSGLPPAKLAAAASTNTINAALVSSQWGLDPATVAGVYGGSGENGGLFAGTSLLPLLTSISHSNAEQALSLIGVQTPQPKSTAPAAAAAFSSAAAATSPQGQATLNDAVAQSSSSPMMVDPLWGRSA